MAHKSTVGRVIGTVADATGRSEAEIRLALTGAAVGAGLLAGLRFLKLLADLGTDVFDRPDREGPRVPRPRAAAEASAAFDRGHVPT